MEAYVRNYIKACEAYGWEGGPEFNTEIIQQMNKAEKRNARWSQSRFFATLPFVNIRPESYGEILSMFEDRKGMWGVFLYRNPLNYLVSDLEFGVGDGVQDEFQLVANFRIGNRLSTRNVYAIYLPGDEGTDGEAVPADVTVYVNGVVEAGDHHVVSDQRIVAGLGNIYVCEALHRASILPTRPGGSLAAPELAALVSAIRAVLAGSNYLIDPHTATAIKVAREREPTAAPMVVLSTAHPAKFPAAVAEAWRAETLVEIWSGLGLDAAAPSQGDRAEPERFAALAAAAGFPLLVAGAEAPMTGAPVIRTGMPASARLKAESMASAK